MRGAISGQRQAVSQPGTGLQSHGSVPRRGHTAQPRVAIQSRTLGHREIRNRTLNGFHNVGSQEGEHRWEMCNPFRVGAPLAVVPWVCSLRSRSWALLFNPFGVQRLSNAIVLLAFVLAIVSPVLAADRNAVEAEVQSKVVKLFGAGGLAGLQGYGTGFVISPNGHIATVWSHLLDGDTVSVVLSNGKRITGKVLAAEPKLDLAVIKIEAEGLDYFDLSTIASAGPGTRIYAFSNMFKVAAGDEPLSVQHGIISARTQLSARRGRFASNYAGPVYVVDAITNNPGAAGGVLTNREGKLLGMLGRELRDSQSQVWVNYVVPIGELAPTLKAMMQGEYTRSAVVDPLAVVRNIPPRTFGMILVPDIVFRTPAYIDEVLPGTDAEKAKLQPDDLIVFLNGKVVNSVRTLQAELNLLQPGQDAEFVIRRGSELITVKFPVPLDLDGKKE
jgi:serine protease Do